ncbi:hypothetical protein U1Q18_004889 [Sarracenia purpurea var. burkii]
MRGGFTSMLPELVVLGNEVDVPTFCNIQIRLDGGVPMISKGQRVQQVFVYIGGFDLFSAAGICLLRASGSASGLPLVLFAPTIRVA